MGNSYAIKSTVTESPSNENFYLHIHTDYEIFLFLEGDSKYIIEENVYPLKTGDIIIIRKNTLHRVYHNSNTRYSRLVINISPEFFEIYGCPEYELQFLLSSAGIGNKIDAGIAKDCGLYDAFMRLKKYSDNFAENESPVVRAILIEILYILNKMESFSVGDTGDKQMKNIISYLNRNFTKNISLEDIERTFFISKYHLCHVFPKITGLTVHQYITDKRLALARDMLHDSIPAGSVAELVGFNDYSSFYRAYKNKYGRPPSSNTKDNYSV